MSNATLQDTGLKIVYVSADALKAADYNPRKWDEAAEVQLSESIKRYGIVDPLLVNSAPGRENVVVGGHFRLTVIKKLGIKTVPVVYLNIPDLEKEKELNLRLNKNTGEFDWDLLAKFDLSFLSDVGFTSEELDDIFPTEETPEQFDLQKELAKLNITDIDIKPGDKFAFGDSYVQCGDSMNEADMLVLMDGQKADMCCTDPPYLLDYLSGKKKKNGKITEGFGLKRDRIYLGTESLPDDFSDLWMANVAKVQKPDFSILIFEHPKNLKTIWTALEKH